MFMALEKGGPDARKIRRVHYLVFEGKAISKKVIVIGETTFLCMRIKLLLKKLFVLGRAIVKCSYDL